jgi:hypothetical protein
VVERRRCRFGQIICADDDPSSQLGGTLEDKRSKWPIGSRYLFVRIGASVAAVELDQRDKLRLVKILCCTCIAGLKDVMLTNIKDEI